MTRVTCRLTAKNRDHSGTLRSVMEYGLALPLPYSLYTAASLSCKHGTACICCWAPCCGPVLRPDCVKVASPLLQQDRQTDRQTHHHYIDPAPPTVRSDFDVYNTSELWCSTTVVYCTDHQALSTARFRRTSQLATADAHLLNFDIFLLCMTGLTGHVFHCSFLTSPL